MRSSTGFWRDNDFETNKLMGYIRQTYLADVLTEAGLTVVEVDDPVTGLPWQDHAAKSEGERNYEPVGLMNHHTASVGN